MCFIQWSTTILVYTTTNNDKINSLQQEGEACSEVESEDDDWLHVIKPDSLHLNHYLTVSIFGTYLPVDDMSTGGEDVGTFKLLLILIDSYN